jgi:DNA polymerase-1
MKLLIDGDIVAYRAAASAEDKSEAIARSRTDETMEQLVQAHHASSIMAYLSGDGNFRYRLYPEYKANRTQERPRWLEDCKEHLIVKWGADVTCGYEADDALAIDATAQQDVIICSIDKDLKQIPGTHWNWVKQERTDITPHEGMYNFYWHVLVGDSADNIKGCLGIGPVKATKLLSHGDTEEDYFEIVQRQYNNDAMFQLNAQLIWLLRHETDIWRLPQ